MIRVGCAGWSIPKSFSAAFPEEGSHLRRYSERLDTVEINSSFYRSHQRKTYARWADSVPPDFRFSVKLPRAITHEARLARPEALLECFFAEIAGLETKLGCVLVQLPPSLGFDKGVVRRFLDSLRNQFAGPCVMEPRHATWFDEEAGRLLSQFNIGRVAADPAVVPDAAHPGGDGTLAYYRLHGSPRKYYSNYDDAHLRHLMAVLRAAAKNTREVWCIFDNTALGFAIGNALEVRAATERSTRIRRTR